MRVLLGLKLLLVLTVCATAQQLNDGRTICAPPAATVVKKVKPTYPAEAKAAGYEGRVILEALIDKRGRIARLRVINNPHPFLRDAALDAVQKWRYKPYLLNGKAVEVESRITVNFKLPKQKKAKRSQ